MLGINSTILKFIAIFLLIVSIASIGGNVWQHFDNSNLSKELALSKENYNTALSNYVICNKTVANLDKNITNQKQKLKNLSTDLNKLKSDIANKEKTNNRLLNKIKNEKKPVTCKELENYLFKNIGNLTW